MVTQAKPAAASKARIEGEAAFNNAGIAAYKELEEWAEKHGPLLRYPGVNMYRGIDMLDNSKSGRPLNRLGLLAVAVEKLKELDRVMESLITQGVGRFHLFPGCSSPADELAVKPDPTRPMSSQAGLVLPTGLSVGHATKIAYEAQINQAPATVLVSKARLIKLELENYILRTHIVQFEKAAGKRVSERLGKMLHESGLLDVLQPAAKIRIEDGIVGSAGYVSPYPPIEDKKDSLIVILKVPSKSLAHLNHRKNVEKRAREDEQEVVKGSRGSAAGSKDAKGGSFKKQKLRDPIV
ncbi:hypothetical protein MMC30_009100 [Trapelia coarctata]|nr:hypothetical protein [Trapelia coarctata]